MIQSINGILLLDKPLTMTSNRALQIVKRLFGAKKAGHTGSLDPLATGMLPICFGEATKFSQHLLDSDKYYRVKATLGEKTTTGDAEGEVIESRPVHAVTHEKIEQAIRALTGEITQIPPMYSAIKQNGRPLYELARKGITVSRKARTVQIYALTLIEFSGLQVVMDVHCSKGTYIRTLVEDMGELLGCGAYVSELRRTAVAPYQQCKMMTLDELTDLQGRQPLTDWLLPMESALDKLPAVTLAADSVRYFCTGQSVQLADWFTDHSYRVYDHQGNFLGVGATQEGRLTPKRLISFQF